MSKKSKKRAKKVKFLRLFEAFLYVHVLYKGVASQVEFLSHI